MNKKNQSTKTYIGNYSGCRAPIKFEDKVIA